jgi:hypothetical protein
MFWPARTLAALSVVLTPALLAAQTAPRYVLTRNLRIDATSANLSPVTWLAVSRTGTIAVGQAQDNLIRFFDARGQSLGTFGRAGEGPGEFRSLQQYGVGWIGDTLWVGDFQLRRFVLITPDRKLLRTVPAALSVKSLGDSSGSTMVAGAVALYADGSQLLDAMVPGALPARPAWGRDPKYAGSRLALITVSAASTFQRLVSFEVRDDCGLMAGADYAFCGRPRFGVDPTGERMAWVSMSYTGPDSGTYAVTAFSRTRETLYARRYPFTPQPIPAHLRDSLAAIVAKAPRRAIPPGMGPHFGPPTIYPAVESVIVASDGSVWVEQRATKDGIPWVMLSPRGDITGTFTVPANVKLMVIGRGSAWGTEKDADDLESVVRFSVARRPGR